MPSIPELPPTAVVVAAVLLALSIGRYAWSGRELDEIDATRQGTAPKTVVELIAWMLTTDGRTTRSVVLIGVVASVLSDPNVYDVVARLINGPI